MSFLSQITPNSSANKKKHRESCSGIFFRKKSVRKRVKTLFAALFIFALLFSIQACKKSKDVDGSGNPLASIEGNIRVPTPEELQLLMPPEFFLDPDGDGSLATNTHWMMSQAHPASLHIPSSIRANFGEGKKVLFYTRLNTKWLNFTTDIRQMLVDNGYTVEVLSLIHISEPTRPY